MEVATLLNINEVAVRFGHLQKMQPSTKCG